MHKYYLVDEDILENLHSFAFISDAIKILDQTSALIHTELTLEELKEYIKQIPPKIPY